MRKKIVKFVTIIMLIANLSVCFGQQVFRGYVLDSAELEVENAIIFLNNTTISTKTSKNGYFELLLPAHVNETKLFISKPAFETIEVSVYEIDTTEASIFFLFPLAEVDTVLEQPAAEKRILKQFKNELLGTTFYAKFCKIENDQDIRLMPTHKPNELVIRTSQPIRITNETLGYRIILDLEEYHITQKTNQLLVRSLRFENLENRDKKVIEKWNKNRAKFYALTPKGYFMNTLQGNSDDYTSYLRSSKEPILFPLSLQSELQNGRLSAVKIDTLISYYTETQKYFLSVEGSLLILYNKSFTEVTEVIESRNPIELITPVNGFLVFDKFGNIYSEYLLQSPMNNNFRYSVILPKDYLSKRDSY